MTGFSLFGRAGPRYFTIGPETPFLPTLAQAIRTEFKDDPIAMADVSVYLPTRRAVRALQEAFANIGGPNNASLLPRITPLGTDPDDETEFDGTPDTLDGLSPISPLRRELVLARMIAARDKHYFNGSSHWPGAISGARELAKLIDSFYTEDASFDRLQDVAPDAFADHWRKSLEFLSIVTSAWPQYLRETNHADPTAHKIAQIKKLEAQWRADPPKSPVVIAGTTGSAPAVARLIDCAANAPSGCIVLPGLDTGCDDKTWAAIDERHPQGGLKRLLTTLKLDRGQVADLTDARPNPSATDRKRLVNFALMPADTTDQWSAERNDILGAVGALDGLQIVEAENDDAEASAIAIKIREAMETPNASIMLVTPDRTLAKRVTQKLQRWRITVDDSAGAPFTDSACGVFLYLSAQWLAEPSDPVALLSLIKHPLFGGGLDQTSHARAVAEMDIALRGVRPHNGLDGLVTKLRRSDFVHPDTDHIISELRDAATISFPDKGFGEIVEAHLAATERLASTKIDDGAERLWAETAGEAGAVFLAELMSVSDGISISDANHYPEIFRQLISGVTVRTADKGDARVSILGPMEARLQSADITILGALNEGTWPRDAAVDPFLSRPMRRTVGLQSPEQRIGLAAHDFVQLAASGDVLLTRAKKSDGAPQNPSRWLLRLKTLIGDSEDFHGTDQTKKFAAYAAALDAPEATIKITPPAPKPPAKARPRMLSVTRIEKLMRDPYAIYASKILHLKKLDPLDKPFGPAEFGSLAHALLETIERNAQLPDENSSRITDIIDQLAQRYGMPATEKTLAQPRLLRAVEHFLAWRKSRAHAISKTFLEVEGRTEFNLPAGPFTLTARADRIDHMKDSAVEIYDYKTGAPPTLKQTAAGFSPQLPLTGLILQAGGFEEVPSGPIAAFAYIRIFDEPFAAKPANAVERDAAAVINDIAEKFIALIKHYDDPDTPYLSQPNPHYTDDYGDFDHLARRREREILSGAE